MIAYQARLALDADPARARPKARAEKALIPALKSGRIDISQLHHQHHQFPHLSELLDRVDRPRGRVAPSGAASGAPTVGPLAKDPLEHFSVGEEKGEREEKSYVFFCFFLLVVVRNRKVDNEKRRRKKTNACFCFEVFQTEDRVSLAFWSGGWGDRDVL